MTYRYVPQPLYRVGQIGLLLEALVRGINALVLGSPHTQTQAVAALSAPVYVWGIIGIVLAVLGLGGEVLMDKSKSDHRAWPSFLAHSGLLFVYAGLALAAGFAVPQGGESTFGTGIVSPADFALLAVWHWIFARRRKHV